jgi:hypothetical protein
MLDERGEMPVDGLGEHAGQPSISARDELQCCGMEPGSGRESSADVDEPWHGGSSCETAGPPGPSGASAARPTVACVAVIAVAFRRFRRGGGPCVGHGRGGRLVHGVGQVHVVLGAVEQPQPARAGVPEQRGSRAAGRQEPRRGKRRIPAPYSIGQPGAIIDDRSRGSPKRFQRACPHPVPATPSPAACYVARQSKVERTDRRTGYARNSQDLGIHVSRGCGAERHDRDVRLTPTLRS